MSSPHGAVAVRVDVRLVDGSAMDWIEPPSILQRLAELEARGFQGKPLIHELLTDDWGPPPVTITLTWTDANGRPATRMLPYD
jgi:hypothetical protein